MNRDHPAPSALVDIQASSLSMACFQVSASSNDRVFSLPSASTALNCVLPTTTPFSSSTTRSAAGNLQLAQLSQLVGGCRSPSDLFSVTVFQKSSRSAMDTTLQIFNGVVGEPRSFDQLDALIAKRYAWDSSFG